MVLTYVLFVTAIVDCLASNNNEWNSRNFDSYFTRLGQRIDQLVIRFDHFDTRINRLTTLVQGRLDSIENSLTTSKLKMDLWGEELSRVEEQLTRKWKNVESKFDLLVPSLDAKLESKLILIQRDNRRHNEHLSSLFTGLGQRVEKSNERVVNLTSTERAICPSRTYPIANNTVHLKSEENLTRLLEDFGNKCAEVLKSGSSVVVSNSKVSNMFEDLVRRSDNIQTGLKDSMSIVNSTRRELQDSFRNLLLNRRSSTSSHGGSVTSSETMSAVVVEALASVESMSTALGRRMAEMSRSIEERFEMVSMTLNGFLESCIRIQDGAPLIEEHIAAVLEKFLDAFDNNTRISTEEFVQIRGKLDLLANGGVICNSFSTNSTYDEEFIGISGSSSNHQQVDNNTIIENFHDVRTQEILKNSEDLTEEEKKALWESLFPNQNVPD